MVVVVLLLVAAVAGYFWIGSRLRPVESLTDYDGRPPRRRARTGCWWAPTAGRA
ncbi:hypothetical protein [Microbispora sp. GKU 823]|uniref:hypothetical protein n=1 Tax=Microbispora sp. GKU 823 TaxID=1652100 RepID=UPI002118B8D6|nr:hypothetical protein [Microbispora sp. GKU 823]